MTEDLNLYIALDAVYVDVYPDVEIRFNGQEIKFPKNKSVQINFPITVKFMEMSILSITLKNKVSLFDLHNKQKQIILNHGILINKIGLGWKKKERREEILEWAYGWKGCDDTTGRTDVAYLNQLKFQKHQEINRETAPFILNETMITKGCTVMYNGVERSISPRPNKIIDLTDNGTFIFRFQAPFAYWALANII
jgi:hypothetical protein